MEACGGDDDEKSRLLGFTQGGPGGNQKAVFSRKTGRITVMKKPPFWQHG